MHELTTRRRIEFSDTDLGGIVHFSRFFVFMETAEDEFLRALGTSFVFEHEGVSGGWPKVEATCEYLSPARYGDELEVHLEVIKLTGKTVTYGITFRLDGMLVASGRTTSVCCASQPDGGFKSIPIPASLADRIDEAPR